LHFTGFRGGERNKINYVINESYKLRLGDKKSLKLRRARLRIRTQPLEDGEEKKEEDGIAIYTGGKVNRMCGGRKKKGGTRLKNFSQRKPKHAERGRQRGEFGERKERVNESHPLGVTGGKVALFPVRK